MPEVTREIRGLVATSAPSGTGVQLSWDTLTDYGTDASEMTFEDGVYTRTITELKGFQVRTKLQTGDTGATWGNDAGTDRHQWNALPTNLTENANWSGAGLISVNQGWPKTTATLASPHTFVVNTGYDIQVRAVFATVTQRLSTVVVDAGDVDNEVWTTTAFGSTSTHMAATTITPRHTAALTGVTLGTHTAANFVVTSIAGAFTGVNAADATRNVVTNYRVTLYRQGTVAGADSVAVTQVKQATHAAAADAVALAGFTIDGFLTGVAAGTNNYFVKIEAQTTHGWSNAVYSANFSVLAD